MMHDDITDLLTSWIQGDRSVEDSLLEHLEPELRRLARRQLVRLGRGLSIESRELVNETYLRLIRQRKANWNNRAHFLALCAQFMRRILVDYARRRRRTKRGGNRVRVELNGLQIATQPPHPDLLALDAALTRLAEEDPVAARVVELRYFGGLTIEEAAAACGVSRTSTVSAWRFAKSWLRKALEPG